MNMLYGVGYSEEELTSFRPIVYQNTINAMKTLLRQAEAFGEREQITATDAIEIVSAAEESASLSGGLGDAIKALWQDPAIQRVWDRKYEFQIVETLQVFFSDIDRLSTADYIPTPMDFIHARLETTGCVMKSFDIEGKRFEMIDVAGQRNRRRKWIHMFSNVTAIIFVAAISEYDQLCREDDQTNRMTEALNLFEEICGIEHFKNTSIILFLNKMDLFTAKFESHPIASVPSFEDFSGTTVEEGGEYFVNHFIARNDMSETDRQVFYHLTTATDGDNVRVVFEACRLSILRMNFDKTGF